jgi:hypothetical protein
LTRKIDITSNHIRSHGLGEMLGQYKNKIKDLLIAHYGETGPLDEGSNLSLASRTQRFLAKSLSHLLQGKYEVELNWRIEYLPKFTRSHTVRQLDIWIPAANIAIEYQGMQHYLDHSYMHGKDGLFSQSLR